MLHKKKKKKKKKKWIQNRWLVKKRFDSQRKEMVGQDQVLLGQNKGEKRFLKAKRKGGKKEDNSKN